MKHKTKFVIKMSLLMLLFGIFYGLQLNTHLFAHFLFLEKVVVMYEEEEISLVVATGAQDHIIVVKNAWKHCRVEIERDACPLPRGAKQRHNEEKTAYLWKLKEQLEREIAESDVSNEEDTLWEDALAQVRKQLDWEVEAGIITSEQAHYTLENIQKGKPETELETLKDSIAHQQKKQEAINTLQDTIASAFKAGNINSQQADEMLINLENGVWDMEHGGVVFDLRKDLS